MYYGYMMGLMEKRRKALYSRDGQRNFGIYIHTHTRASQWWIIAWALGVTVQEGDRYPHSTLISSAYALDLDADLDGLIF